MAIHERGTEIINELMSSVEDSPDFSFLNEWQPSSDTFFPRLNNSPNAKENLNGEDRKKVRVAADAIEEVNKLLEDTTLELSESKGDFSNSISVFLRDGEVSVVAVPVTKENELAMGGFLFAHDLLNLPNSDLFLDDLKSMVELIPPTEGYLRWRWWPVKKDERQLNKRSAAQLLLSATNPGNRNIHHIADLVESRSQFSSGRTVPNAEDWRAALLKLDSLKEFPPEAVISTIDLDQMAQILSSIETLREGFNRRDSLMAAGISALNNLAASRSQNHADTLSIDAFSQKVKGKGFARKILSGIADVEVYGNDRGSRLLGGGYPSHSIGDIMRLAKSHPYMFSSKTLQGSLKMIEVYMEDQKRLLGYPRLSDTDAAFEEFLRLVYRFYLDQQRPYPSRSSFESLEKLLRDQPNQLHLIARNKEAVTKLIGTLDVYSDSKRMELIGADQNDPTVTEARNFFKENPATYQAVLSSMGLNALSLEQISGFLAPELTSEIRNIEVDLSGMKSPLRSYQVFGVQYALHQKRVLLGDEMGLGKTVTALGLMNHLSNEGDNRFLITMPLAVLENWRREVLKHTNFVPYVLHGETLDSDLTSWVSEGGIALTTFESIQKVNQHWLIGSVAVPALVIVDEAHYIKNPETRRAKGILPWLKASERALLMTGTALENKLEEFETLIHYVQPSLPIPADKLAYSAFRKAIAPAYLRRNQVDVLQEIPELQDDEEYIELSDADAEYYKRALKNNDWHQARRAKILAGENSSTVQRIKDIVRESNENGHKVLIFSFYRETIDVLQRVLHEDDPYTPITGDLDSVERLTEVDKFTKAEKPGVLLAQITAGGTGLNIQAASVVILVEPQTKPSLEEQAIRRSFRMGQTKAVRVIRLRGKNTADERWVKNLAEKKKLFALTAGVSDAAALDNAVSGASAKLMEEERLAWGV